MANGVNTLEMPVGVRYIMQALVIEPYRYIPHHSTTHHSISSAIAIGLSAKGVAFTAYMLYKAAP
jgi:hypothetical protein